MTDRNAFDVHKYWAERTHKKWVVHLSWKGGHRVMYVQARSEQRAINCARRNNYSAPKGAQASAWLASPDDLGCVSPAPYERKEK